VSKENRSSALRHLAPKSGTKGAVDAITGVLSRELGARKIRVNALNPGVIETEREKGARFIYCGANK
jgi:NAD(P)-dependent dehydrogenase (short-subunit alcohol dehydrogenase family)